MLNVEATWLCITFAKERPLPCCRLDRPWCRDNIGNTEVRVLILYERAPVFSSTQLRTLASLISYWSVFMTIVCITVSFNWCVCFAAPKFLKERQKKNQSGIYKCSQNCFIHKAILSFCVKIVVSNQQFEDMKTITTRHTHKHTRMHTGQQHIQHILDFTS